jgi:hypothetical protein
MMHSNWRVEKKVCYESEKAVVGAMVESSVFREIPNAAVVQIIGFA